MKKVKFLIPFLALSLTIGMNDVNGQGVKISKEVQKSIKEKEQEIRTNEEMLMNGVDGIERTKLRLEKAKKKAKITPEEIAKRERILSKVEGRLSLLDEKIKKQKDNLTSFMVENKVLAKAPSVKERAIVTEKKAEKQEEKAVVENTEEVNIEARKERLKQAREKLEKERLEREAAHKLEQEKLAALDNEIKAEEASIEQAKKAAENKALAEKNKKQAEKQKKIEDLEDDIFVSEEILMSGKEGLVRSKERLEKAKSDANVSPEDLVRKESIVKRVEERLSKIVLEIKEKREMIKVINEE